MRIAKLHKRSTSNSGDGRKKGSCVKLKPCGTEAACSQYDKHTYICVCPHDFSHPNEELKCPNRTTVPMVAYKPLANFSIFINDGKLTTASNLITTTPGYANTSIQTPISPTFNRTAQFVRQEKQLTLDILGVGVRVNYLILLAIMTFVLSVLITLAVCWSRKSSTCCRRKVKKNNSPVPLFKNVIQEESFAMNPTYTSPSDEPQEKYLVPHLSKKCISSMEEIGQGYFGKVYKATLTHSDGLIEMVAIKVMKDTANPEAKDDFKRETEIMTYFRHPNIVTLLGVCADVDKTCPWMIFEYMAYGDLTEVLRNSTYDFGKFAFGQPVLDSEALWKISLQIADGMKYLASQRFVHRDLACRNCLVGLNLTVKIADFGMSRDIYTSDYYKMGVNRLLPVRWMSPECIIYGKFTLESDVWSYGVVLWEIYTLGKQPYYGYSNNDALRMIQEGVLLEIPTSCPAVIGVLMNGCWKTDPKERPRFADICDRLAKGDLPGSPLPRPPALPAVVDHLSLQWRMMTPEDGLLDEDDYLQPNQPPVDYEATSIEETNVEYIEYDEAEDEN